MTYGADKKRVNMSLPIIAITGASSGIGAATARRFAQENYKVILLARRKEKLDELHQELGSNTYPFKLDVTSRQTVEQTFEEIQAKIGSIDILVNNAGGAFGLDKAQDANLDEWMDCVNVNINGLLFCTHAVLPNMVKRNQGHIINIGSVAGLYPYPGGSVYCAAKAFVHQFSLSLKADLLGTQVRSTCIEPGLTGHTEFSLNRFRGDKERAAKTYEKTTPLFAEDIANAIFFCANCPPHVNINTMEIMPTTQAFSSLTVKRGE